MNSRSSSVSCVRVTYDGLPGLGLAGGDTEGSMLVDRLAMVSR
ncbi:hypothetical protein [Streptomyces sp. NPDC093795]